MGSSFALAAVAAALTVQSAIAVPAVPTPLAPSSPWTVEYAEKMCVLQRTFGADNQEVTVGLKPAPAGTGMTVVLLTQGKRRNVTTGDAKLTFDGASEASGRFIAGPVRNGVMRIVAIDLKREDLSALPSAKQVRIEAANVDVTIVPSRIADAMKVLEACEADLLESWGMDPTVIANIAEYPTTFAPFYTYFSSDDYPSEALSRDEQGLAGVRVFVDAHGKVSECSVVESSGSQSIDAKTCAVVKNRFRYKPARLKSGESAASFTYVRVRWEIPGI